MKTDTHPKGTFLVSDQKGRRRIQYDCSEPLITDQSGAREADVNNIMLHYTKSGMLPQIQIQGSYSDNSNTPSLEDAFRIAKSAQDAFYTLPPNIRRLMDNDPSQLENFVANPNNADVLLKEGVLVARKEPAQDPIHKGLEQLNTTMSSFLNEKTKREK